MIICHKTEVQTVILRCLTSLNLNWFKICYIKCKYFHFQTSKPWGKLRKFLSPSQKSWTLKTQWSLSQYFPKTPRILLFRRNSSWDEWFDIHILTRTHCVFAMGWKFLWIFFELLLWSKFYQSFIHLHGIPRVIWKHRDSKKYNF